MKINLFIVLFTLVCHVNGQAQVTFQRTYGTVNEDNGNSVAATSDGGYIIGTVYNNGLCGVIKTDANGDTVWTKTYPYVNTAIDNKGVTSIIQTNDNNYVLVGVLDDEGSYILKINNVGDTLWMKRSGHTVYPVRYSKIIEDNSGNLVIAGSEEPNLANLCCFPLLIKTDSNGNPIPSWTLNIPCEFFTGCRLQEIFLDNEGNYIVSGDAPSPNAPRPRLTKVNTDGSIMWNKYYTTINASARGITHSDDNGYLFVGPDWSFGDSTILFKTDNNGNLLWLKKYKGNNTSWQGTSIVQTNGGYFIAGSNTNVFLMKIDLNYNLVWSNEFGGSLDEVCLEMKSTSDNGCIIIGSSKSYGAGADDVYFIKTDQNGIAVGQNEIFQPTHKLSILPNPFSSLATLNSDKPLVDGTLKLFNALGQQVRQVNNINGQTLTIQRDKLTSGLYYLQLTKDHQTIATNKIVITDF